MRRGWQGILSLFCCALASGHAQAAAWLQEEGRGEIIVNAVYYTTESSFDNNGNERTQPRFTKKEINPYLEYGLTDAITIGANVNFQDLSQDSGGDNAGMGDAELFFRMQVWEHEGAVVSLQPLIKIPGPYDSGDAPALGSDQTDVEMRVLLGQGFAIPLWNAYPHFMNVEAAYRYRDGAPSDEWRFDGTLGLRPAEHTLILNQLFSVFALNEKTAPLLLANSRDYDLVKYQLSLVQDIVPGTSVQAGVFRHLSGENTGAGGGALLSVWQAF